MLKRVSIQNFKSLKDVTLDLQKVNLLIGPNNSGKTNFLKALEFFTARGLDLHRIADLESISYKHQRIDLTSKFEFVPDSSGFIATNYNEDGYDIYHFNQSYIVEEQNNSYEVKSTISDWFTTHSGIVNEGKVEGGHRREFFDFVRTKIFRPDPSKLIHAAKLSGSNVELAPDGSNLIPFYFSIFNNHEENSVKIQSDLSRCVPEIARFRTPPVEGENMLGLRFFDKHEASYWASEVSEGVLYFLILLCIVNQPNPPRLLLLEEPERGIHPRRIWEVMKLVFALAEEKGVQIIMTTHNEHVVNAFSAIPESVFVFDKDEETGATTVRNLRKDIIEPSHRESEKLGLKKIDFTADLGERWMYGLIGGVPADEL
ncbi:AAA family ATPase [Spirosoma taeanense]|uniref:AAA family ATPase n=1 Tax=Spirosoma taeanense TaxID=2735870 RepID=A0A6M5Y5I4_9BACT|nr:AAA family ATPase [Spirosoma taeanense]QJW88353.1 AAA family ATPase [Spirosoma taeanense]